MPVTARNHRARKFSPPSQRPPSRLRGDELEQRVALKHAELEQNYQRMQQMERQAAVVEERQRIMSDMHDVIGAQLIRSAASRSTGRCRRYPGWPA